MSERAVYADLVLFKDTVECDIGHSSSKITVPYTTLFPLYLMISF